MTYATRIRTIAADLVEAEKAHELRIIAEAVQRMEEQLDALVQDAVTTWKAREAGLARASERVVTIAAGVDRRGDMTDVTHMTAPGAGEDRSIAHKTREAAVIAAASDWEQARRWPGAAAAAWERRREAERTLAAAVVAWRAGV